MKKKISLLLCAGLLLSMLTGCSGGKLDLTWFTSKFTGKTAEDLQQEQEAAAAEEAAAPEATAVVTEVFNDISSFGLAYQKNYGVHPYDCESLNNRCILSFLYEPLFVVSSENFEASPVLASRLPRKRIEARTRPASFCNIALCFNTSACTRKTESSHAVCKPRFSKSSAITLTSEMSGQCRKIISSLVRILAASIGRAAFLLP